MNLHYFITFSSRGSGICRSLFLRTFMVMILFITGSNGIYAGEDLKATIGTPASKGSWDGTKNEYSWQEGTNNLMPIFTGLKGQSQVTVSPSETGKGTVYFTIGNDTKQHTNATVPNHTKVKFYAQPNTEKVVFTGWDVAGEVIYDNPAEVEVTGDLNVIARFPDGIHISCTVDPNGAAEPEVYQKDHREWPLPVDGYVGPDQATTFAFKNQQKKYKFLGWYDENNKELSTETSYTVDKINAETNVIAKFSTDIQNNTQRYDLSNFNEITNSGNVQSATYDVTEKTLKVMTKEAWDNYFPLYKDLNGTTSTGVRLHAKGVKFRIVAKTSDDKTFQVNVPANDDYVTRHYKWEDFVLQNNTTKMTEADVAKITQIGLAGDNAAGETDKVFYVKEFWLDDIADYDKTIPCYGDEGGQWDWGKTSFVYTTAGATAVFEKSNTRDANHNIILNPNKKVTLSSDVNKFTEVCLVFGAETKYDLTVAGKQYTGTSTAVICPVNSSELTIKNNSEAIYLSKIIYSSEKVGINEERTITVDGETRNYWLYVPASLEGRTDVPVVFSLHGRYNTDKPDDPGKPLFTSLAKEKGFIVVYPQGRNGGEKPNDWNNGFVGTTGWEATGKENADTKFIKALVDKIQSDYKTQSDQNSHISVDPKKFYLCGFSMGGMMTYACAKVLNGTFAAYGSCGGFPLNEFHLNLATKQPVPFMHLHGDADKVVGINHLHTIIENLLFRNGCKLSQKQNNDDGWTTTTVNDMTRYDFKGVNGVPVTTVTFKNLEHWVHSSAPQYLWDFFSPKTLDTYMPTTMKWQWDMTTINSNLSASNGYPYGWKRVIDNGRYLSYGDNRKTDDNHNVYNSIQLEKGTYKLHAKANVVSSDATGIIVGIYKVGETENSGKCIIRRQVKNNSGEASADLSILYPFAITEDGEYYVKVERGNESTTCTDLAIHTSDYAPDDEDDSENAMKLDDGWQDKDLIVKIDFNDVGTDCDKIGEEKTATMKYEGEDANGKYNYVLFTGTAPEYGDNTPKYDVYNLYCRYDGDNIQKWKKTAVIQNDAIFGNYFQNIPKAQFYDRSAENNYMRAVLPKGALIPIKDSGAATIGFWVNGRVAVDAGLSYFDASMLYLSGPYHSNLYAPTGDDGNDESHREYQSMFNIRCNGHTNGFLKDATSNQVRYYANNMFGDLCDNSSIESYYKKNLYLDRNWHYITMVMYNNLRNVDMYVDGELTQSRQNIVGSGQDLTAGLDTINHIIIGGLNATYTEFTYDPAFAFDDIVIYSRALTPQEIQAIIAAKNYSPNSWDFEKNIANTALLNKDKLKDSYWTYDQVNDVYTLIKKLDTPAELTYDGNRVIPAFRGLKFKTTKAGQVKIDMANKRLIVEGVPNSNNSEEIEETKATKMTISNAPAGQYIRYEYETSEGVWLDTWDKQTFQGDKTIQGADVINNLKTGIAIVNGTSERQTCTMRVNNTVKFKSIDTTDKIFADLTFGTLTNENKTYNKTETIEWVKTDGNYPTLPTLYLFNNGRGFGQVYNSQDLTNDEYLNENKTSGKINFWSSAPHVAYVTSANTKNNQPVVNVTGVPGSAYIYAELPNDNKYDCSTDDADLYASSNRILARYEIHVPNSEPGYSVKISADETHTTDETKFPVGYVLETTDQNKAVTLTLGGWKYNSGEYFKKTDGYTKKETWKGMPLNKTTNDTNGYKSVYDVSDKSGNYTDDNTYTGLGSYTGGTHAAKSEQLDGADNKGLFVTEYANNSTAWTLPCRGSYAKVEPTEAGIISVYVLQEGCMERNMTGTEQTYFDSYKVAANEPYDINIKKVYVADEAGKIIDDVITDTKSKIVSQVWKDDGRARAEYSFVESMKHTAYSELLHDRFQKNIVNAEEDAVALLDKWNSPGMTQNIIPYRKGYAVIDKGIVRYTFNVLPGKTYYIFSNDAKMGIAGFNFTKNKQLNFNSKHEIIADNPLADDLTATESVTLNDNDNYSPHTEKNANVTLNRTFYKNRWNAICLPYSINRRQIEKVFGDGTMVVLMNYIDTSNKKVMFIEHANQDIIAGYPYLIFPTDKADNDKTNHSVINNGTITTRATFGEANSPLFSVGTDGNTYPFAEQMQSDALVFKGTFKNAKLKEGSYVVTNKGVLSRIPKDEMNIKPYRSYIYFNRVNTGAKAISLQDMNVNGFENDEDHTTGIENLLFESGILTHSADVYSIDGQLVRSKALNFNGLPKGVYIVNGKKYVKK